MTLEQLARDLAFASRALRRSPGVSLLSILTMGAGIGATTVLFALVNATVLRPLPYPQPDRLVRIFDTNLKGGIARSGVASGNIDDWRRRASSFDGIAAFYAMGRTLSTDADSEVLIAAQVSQDFFRLFGVEPILGRTFTDEDVQRADYNDAAAPIGPDPVLVMSHSVWQQRFAGDRAIIGRTVLFERRPFRVVGVMPRGFAMPERNTQFWIPLSLSGGLPRDQHYLGSVARVKPAVSLAQASEDLNRVAQALGTEYPATNEGWGVELSSLHDDLLGDTATILWVLFGAVGLVLLVACANIALLSLIRGLDRSHETAIRQALGASSGRLLREFLMEGVLLAVLGGAVGALIATVSLRVLPRLSVDVPRLDEVLMDGRGFLFILILTALTAVLSGLPQAWRRARAAPLSALSQGSSRTTTGRERHFLRDTMVVGQVLTAVVLLSGSVLLVRTVLNLRAVDPGFDPRGVLVAPVFLDSQAYSSGNHSRAYYRTLFERLTAIPGVTAVGGATTVPTSPLGPDFERPVWPQGTPEHGPQRTSAWVRMVTPGYFPALGLRVAAGRAIDDRDHAASPRVLMVNETLASRIWPGQRAVGRQLVVDYSTAGTYPYEIVGVVGDVRFRGPRATPQPEISLAHAQRPYLIMNVVLKTAGDPGALIPTVRAVLKEVDPQKPAHGIYRLTDLVGATYERDRQAMLTLVVFAATAIFMAVLSVYGVLSQCVRERSREIGIRVALGAGTLGVIRWVGGIGARLIAMGLAAGLLVAWALGGVLDGLLFGVRATDAVTTAVVMLLVAAIGLLATLVPSWRATRVDPLTILRQG